MIEKKKKERWKCVKGKKGKCKRNKKIKAGKMIQRTKKKKGEMKQKKWKWRKHEWITQRKRENEIAVSFISK